MIDCVRDYNSLAECGGAPTCQVFTAFVTSVSELCRSCLIEFVDGLLFRQRNSVIDVNICSDDDSLFRPWQSADCIADLEFHVKRFQTVQG